jgi:hypothetical protein
VFNLTPRNNYTNPSGNISAADFLILDGLPTSTNPRLLQIGFRIGF